MHAISHRGCTDTVRESALKVDSGRKAPCESGNLTRVRIVPDFSVRMSTNKAVTPLFQEPANREILFETCDRSMFRSNQRLTSRSHTQAPVNLRPFHRILNGCGRFTSCVRFAFVNDSFQKETPPRVSLSSNASERCRKRKRSIFLEWTREGIVNQMNIGTVSKATLGGNSERGWSAHGLFRAHRYHLQLNWRRRRRRNVCSVIIIHYGHAKAICSNVKVRNYPIKFLISWSQKQQQKPITQIGKIDFTLLQNQQLDSCIPFHQPTTLLHSITSIAVFCWELCIMKSYYPVADVGKLWGKRHRPNKVTEWKLWRFGLFLSLDSPWRCI